MKKTEKSIISDFVIKYKHINNKNSEKKYKDLQYKKRGDYPKSNKFVQINIIEKCEQQGIKIREIKKEPDRNGNGNITIYVLEECLFNQAHGKDASIIQFDDGNITYQCFHHGCKERGITKKELLEKIGISPEDSKSSYKDDKETPAEICIKLIDETKTMFFHDAEKKAYAKKTDGEIMPVYSQTFKLYCKKIFFEKFSQNLKDDQVKEVQGHFESVALFINKMDNIKKRIAKGSDGNIYLDLCNAELEVVRIAKNGWDIVKKSEATINFMVYKGMLPLPKPKKYNGNTLELLNFLNLSNNQKKLVFAWMAQSMNPEIPYLILVIEAGQGSGKTFITVSIKKIIDPHFVRTLSIPKSEDDLQINCEKTHIQCIDNISSCPDWLSDSFCRCATGSGQAKEPYILILNKLFSLSEIHKF